jgi:hypothetical protein
MEQQKTHQELLDQLVLSQNISKEQADDLAFAPRFSFSVRELITYLAGLIIAVGVIRIISVAFENASKGAIIIALYLVSALCAFASQKLGTKSTLLNRFAEVLELGSLGAALGATGVALDAGNLDEKWIAVILSGAAVAWGGYRCMRTQFAGTVVLTGGIPALAISLSQFFNQDNASVSGTVTLIAGVLLVTLGVQRVHASFLPRAFGAMWVFSGSMMLGNNISAGQPLPILTGAALFAAGSALLAPELLLVGAVCIVSGIVMSVSEWVHNEMAQGFVIVAAGLVVLLVLRTQMRKAISQPKLDAPTA